MSWQFNNTEPIYLQIVEKIKLEIIYGNYNSKMQLPSVRQLADDISVNPNTVQRAMLQLEEEGIVYTQGTTGRFIMPDEKLPQNLKEALAQKYLNTFFITMQNLGFNKSEILNLIEKNRNEV